MEKDITEEANKKLCKANPEQLLKEVVTEIVDQRMKRRTLKTVMKLAKEPHG